MHVIVYTRGNNTLVYVPTKDNLDNAIVLEAFVYSMVPLRGHPLSCKF